MAVLYQKNVVPNDNHSWAAVLLFRMETIGGKMNISLLKEQLGEKYTFDLEENSIFIYSNHYEYEPVIICTEDGLYGVERGNNILISDMGSLENNIIACCIYLGKDKDKVDQYCAEIRRKIKSTKDNTELE